MPATVRYDEQYCPIARALDMLGDRWTLLVLRELMGGDRRFTDLRDSLPGVAPGVLTNRLHALVEQGLVTTVDGDGARPRYSITRRGRDAAPVMRALARFGMPLLEDPDDVDADHLRPWSAVQTCVLPYWDAAAAAGVDERYLFRVAGEEHTVSTAKGGGAPKAPALTIDVDAATLFAIRQGRISFDDAVASGAMVIAGPPAAVRSLRRVFRFD